MYLLGIDPTEVWPLTPTDLSATRPPALGTIGFDKAGRAYELVQADASGLTTVGMVALMKANIASMITTANTAAGSGFGCPAGVVMAVVAANGFGWLARKGTSIPTRVLASCAAYTRLNTTATAGCLDDDGTASSRQLTGITLEAANGGATGNVNATLSWPVITPTL